MIVFALSALLAAAAPASADPADVVAREVAAYNAHDAAAFGAQYAEDAELWDFPGRLALKGREAIAARYAKRFADSPNVRSEIVKRETLGNKVVDRERIFGAAPVPDGYEVLVIYLIRDGRIAAKQIIRPE